MDSGCSYTIAMGRLVRKNRVKEDSVMQWHTKDGNITTNYKVKKYFTLTAINATNVVMWKCHVDNSTKGRYGMTLGQ